jgi:hypothetical protein
LEELSGFLIENTSTGNRPGINYRPVLFPINRKRITQFLGYPLPVSESITQILPTGYKYFKWFA